MAQCFLPIACMSASLEHLRNARHAAVFRLLGTAQDPYFAARESGSRSVRSPRGNAERRVNPAVPPGTRRNGREESAWRELNDEPDRLGLLLGADVAMGRAHDLRLSGRWHQRPARRAEQGWRRIRI